MDFANVLTLACDPLISDSVSHWNSEFTDTSCSYVPFGYVLTIQAKIHEVDSLEYFWAACLSSDDVLNMLPANIRSIGDIEFKNILTIIREDLLRVKNPNGFREVEFIMEKYSVENACPGCCGAVLLLKSENIVSYLHWHRES